MRDKNFLRFSRKIYYLQFQSSTTAQEPLFGGFPIDDIPDPIDIRSFVIEVLLSLALDTHGRRDNYLKIVCMLPHINTKDRCEITNDRVLILCPKPISGHQGDPSIYGANLSSDYVELVGLLVFHEPAPSIR